MTTDSILDIWTYGVDHSSHRYSAEYLKAYEDFITDGKELSKDHISSKWLSGLWGVPAALVKEIQSGDNPDTARRALWLILKVSKHTFIAGFGFSSGDIEACRLAGYSFSEIMSECNWTSVADYLLDSMSYAFWNVYGDETAVYITAEQLAAEAANKKTKSKLICMLGILSFAALSDGEKYRIHTDMILKYLHSAGSGAAVRIICRIYDLSENTVNEFRKYAENVHSYYSMEKYISKKSGKTAFKELIFRLGLHSRYYRAYILNYFNNSADVLKKGLEELYSENREMFKDVCLEIINDKNEEYSERVMYPLAVLHNHNDGKREFDAVSGKISHYVWKLVYKQSGIRSKDKVDTNKFADFMKRIEQEEVITEGFSMNFAPYAKCCGIEEIFEFMSLFFGFFKMAENCVKLLMKYAYTLDDHHNLGEFYTVFTESRTRWLGIPESESLRSVSEFMPVYAFFMMYCYSCSNSWAASRTRISRNTVSKIASENSDKAFDYFSKISDIQYTAAWTDLYYSLEITKNYKPLTDALKGKSKTVRKKALEIASGCEAEIRDDLEKMLPKLKGDAALSVSQLIRRWDNIRKFGENFEFSSNEFTEEFCKENISRAALKKIEWIDEMSFDGIRYADLSGTASHDVMKYILSEYMSLDEPCRLVNCDSVAERLNRSDLQDALENIYTNWIEDGSDTKKKFITLPYCLYASDSQILKMKKQLETWAAASRGQLAAFTVKNIALNGGSIALLTVDTISGKFPNNMVKKAAKGAIEFAAETLEISVDELTDRIVPSLGFSKNGERIFDYGARTFTVSLMPDFSLTIHDDQKDKDIKSMPKPAASDDEVKAESARKEFSELKKQIKAVVSSQKQRLEKVFMNGRTWTADNWRILFEENALMHCFAETLIWGVYENEKLVSSFRYLQDGSFCDENDDEYELPENAEITLVHPSEMDEDLIEKWSVQLEDYEITQPFSQIASNVITLNEDEVISSEGEVTKYNGKNVITGKIASVAKKYDMVRGEAGDGGSFEGYWLYDTYLGVSMNINAEYFYFGQEYDETVPISCVKFFSNGHPADPLALKNRFISGCMNIIENMTEEE